MACQIRNLNIHSYAHGMTIWGYITSRDTLEQVLEPKYFQDADSMLHRGDFIWVSSVDGGSILWVGERINDTYIIHKMVSTKKG